MKNEDYEALLENLTNLVSGINKLCDRLDRVADRLEDSHKARYYLADCIGFLGDGINSGGVKLRYEGKTRKDKPIVKDTQQYSFDQIRDIMNEYARKNGKEAALELLRKYTEALDLNKVKKEDYSALIEEAAL